MFYQPFTFQPGSVYNGSVWLRSASNSLVQFELRGSNDVQNSFQAGASHIVTVDTNWQQVTINGGWQNGSYGQFSINFLTNGTFWIDDASLGRPDTVRGYSANVLLTEFAFFEDPAATWRAIVPAVTNPMRGGVKKVRLITTPNGIANKAHKIWEENYQGRDGSASASGASGSVLTPSHSGQNHQGRDGSPSRPGENPERTA
jgi:hypothetical protein